MKKMKKKDVILFLIVIAIITFIIFNGSQSSEASNLRSDKIIAFFQGIFDPDKRIEDKDWLFVIRKAAHVVEYMLLGAVSGYIYLLITKKIVTPYCGYPLFACVIVALVDEYIQSFSGRTSKVQDILIDSGGAILGMIIVAVIFHCMQKKHRRRRNKYNMKDLLK